MITIRISILLAFSLPANSSTKDSTKGKTKGKAKKNKGKADKGTKGSSKKSGKKKGKTSEKPVVVKPRYLYEVGAPIGFAHVEYELIPGRPKYQIDVVCWGPIAKVFTEAGDFVLKTFLKNETAWVPVTVKHVLNQLEKPDLMKLYSHEINYTILTTKNKLGARAKAEKTKAFFIREEDVDSQEKFTEAYITDPNLETSKDIKNDWEEEIRNIIWECADQPGTKNYQEIVTRLEFLSDPVHRYQVNKIIDTVAMGKTFECKDFAPICPPPSTEEETDQMATKQPRQKGKKDKSSKKGSKKGSKKDNASSKASTKKSKSTKPAKKQKGDGVLKITVPGEVLYTDPWLSIYNLKNSGKVVTHAFVLTTAKNIMKRIQKYQLNPLIIKIKKLSNLPVEILKKHRFTEIYADYNIPFIARCSTLQKPLEKVIKFNEAHAHFTDSVPKLKLLEFMQTRRLYIEIRGVREEYKKPDEPNLFGTEIKDKNFSERLKARDCPRILESKEEPSIVTLGVACLNISSLLKPTWDFAEKTSVHNPQNPLFQKTSTMYNTFEFIDSPTTNEINLAVLCKPKSWSPFSENTLTDFGTTLKVEVHLSAPFSGILEVQSNPDAHYQRLFVVVNRVELATTLLNEIMMYNRNVLGPDVVIYNFLKGIRPSTSKLTLPKVAEVFVEHGEHSLAVSGFMIDNGNSYAFFVEGLANGFVSDIWNQVNLSRQMTAKVFYNSDFCFEKRLYWEFLNLGGMIIINLKAPLNEILSQEALYLEGNVPIPCLEALMKLSLLLQCPTQRAMNQYCLFPTAMQLRSLSIEYGVPFKWQHEHFSFGEPLDKFRISDIPLAETHLFLS